MQIKIHLPYKASGINTTVKTIHHKAADNGGQRPLEIREGGQRPQEIREDSSFLSYFTNPTKNFMRVLTTLYLQSINCILTVYTVITDLSIVKFKFFQKNKAVTNATALKTNNQSVTSSHIQFVQSEIQKDYDSLNTKYVKINKKIMMNN